jgi:hypothetical protein
VIRRIRHRLMTTCGIAGPAFLLLICFGTGFTVADALGAL